MINIIDNILCFGTCGLYPNALCEWMWLYSYCHCPMITCASDSLILSAGIIDPAKIVRCAIQDAASIVGLLITTETMVANEPVDPAAAPAMPTGGTGGMPSMM